MFLGSQIGREEMMTDFLTFSFSSAKIYLIIIGIIGGYHYFPMFVQLGVSRKQSFKGMALGMFSGAAILVLMAILVSSIQRFVLPNDAIRAELLVDTLLSTNQQGNLVVRWGLTLLIFCLSATLDLVIGWLLAAGFYKGKQLIKLGSLLLGIFLFANGMLWEIEAWTFLPGLTFIDHSLSRIVWTLLAIGFGLLVIRQLTKRVTIKLSRKA